MKRPLMTVPRLVLLNSFLGLIFLPCFVCPTAAQDQGDRDPLVPETTHFNEVDGIVAVEAEHFFKQELTDKRAFYHTHSENNPAFEMDGDPAHVGGASNGAYLEILPDTRRNHGEKLIAGTNFSNEAGKLAVVHYKVNITNPGRYYVWVRAHSTGSEDNGIHVGLNGEWPESGQRMQWCAGKNKWFWESKQRTKEKHCGVPHQIFLDIDEAGIHTVHFSMREDGFEFDKWFMTTDRDFERPEDEGPVSTSNVETLPSFPLVDSSVLEKEMTADPSAKKQESLKKQPTEEGSGAK